MEKARTLVGVMTHIIKVERIVTRAGSSPDAANMVITKFQIIPNDAPPRSRREEAGGNHEKNN